MKYVYSDGGRSAAGYKGATGDCVVRAVSIASGKHYEDVYKCLSEGMKSQRSSKHKKRSASARNGVSVTRKWFKDLMREWGFVWVPTMTIGSGCKTHLRDGELPLGKLVVSLSKHYCAVIDGVIYDTHDPSRDGTRCVYGYWILEGTK